MRVFRVCDDPFQQRSACIGTPSADDRTVHRECLVAERGTKKPPARAAKERPSGHSPRIMLNSRAERSLHSDDPTGDCREPSDGTIWTPACEVAMMEMQIAVYVLTHVQKLLPAYAVPELLFGGKIGSQHRTKFAFNETVDRYKASIKDLNRSLTLTIGLTVIALYAYLVLPASGEVEVPFVAIKVSRLLWIRTVPAIAYGLQVLGFTAFIWFMLLRLALRLLLSQRTGTEDDYGDVTNIALEGPLGHLWMILQIRRLSFRLELSLVLACTGRCGNDLHQSAARMPFFHTPAFLFRGSAARSSLQRTFYSLHGILRLARLHSRDPWSGRDSNRSGRESGLSRS